MESLLTIDEVAERLRTSPRFVRRLIEERRIAYVKVGTHVRVEAAELATYIEARRVVPIRRDNSTGRAA